MNKSQKVTYKPQKVDNELPCKYLGQWISLSLFFASCLYSYVDITDDGYSFKVDVKMAKGKKYNPHNYDHPPKFEEVKQNATMMVGILAGILFLSWFCQVLVNGSMVFVAQADKKFRLWFNY